MLNKVMIIGRLGRDPELRYTQSGSPVATLNVATDESYMDRDGNKVERTEWHRVSVFQRQAENCANFLTKGSLVYVEGSLQTRKWQDQNGQDRYTTEIKAQRVQFLRELPRGHFIAPPCFRSDVAVKNEFRGIVPACWLEVPKVFILRFCLRRCRFLHFLLPPLTFFLRASTARRFGRSLNRSFP